jgi:TatD DNase family protein
VTLNLPLDLVDVHCHLNFDEFDHDRVQVIERAWENGIKRILNPGIDVETSKTALKCSYDYPQLFVAVGVHPNSALSWTQNSLTEIKQLAGEEKVVAIGEIGLDYYRNYAPRELQRSTFIQQLELAADIGLPVIIHNRDASEDILDILRIWHKELVERGSTLANHPGELHSFSGTLDLAQEIIQLNFKIGISGPVTFRNSHTLQSVVSTLSLERMLLETDAPYLSPHPFRGKRNEPANVRIVANKVAELKAISIDQVAKTTTAEANKLFNWREIH